MRITVIRTAIAAAAALVASQSQAMVINIIDQGGVTGSVAEQGFKFAAQYWGSMFTNNATINLGVRFAPIANPNVIGQTGSARQDFTVADWQAGVNATKSNSAIDQAVVLPGLSGAGGVSGLTTGVNAQGHNTTAVTGTLNGTQVASQVLYANTSVIKAVGGTVLQPNALDGSVTFSTNFSFDFNPLDGITAGKMDFLGVAIHEMGHALGFVSGVDLMDYYSFGNGPGKGLYGDLNDTSLFSALDMFRYSAPGTLDLRVGGTKYFSIDGGQTALFGNTFSTGSYNGDGRQASHWKDAVGCSGQLGIMDPTFCYGQMGEVTGLDLAAYDAMGWNLAVDAMHYQTRTTAAIYAQYIPEPSSWALMFTAFGAMGLLGRRKRQAAPQA